jgi:hypothetical protein
MAAGALVSTKPDRAAAEQLFQQRRFEDLKGTLPHPAITALKAPSRGTF